MKVKILKRIIEGMDDEADVTTSNHPKWLDVFQGVCLIVWLLFMLTWILTFMLK